LQDANELIVGLPVSGDGSETTQSNKVWSVIGRLPRGVSPACASKFEFECNSATTCVRVFQKICTYPTYFQCSTIASVCGVLIFEDLSVFV
jgi:hypothetical protein